MVMGLQCVSSLDFVAVLKKTTHQPVLVQSASEGTPQMSSPSSVFLKSMMLSRTENATPNSAWNLP